MRNSLPALGVLVISLVPCFGQTPFATINGRIVDTTRAVIQDARVDSTSLDTNIRYSTTTSSSGLFTINNLPPGRYRIEISKPGFRTIVKPELTLHVQDVIALNFEMLIGSTSESITVEGGAPLINTESAAVSTVVDRNFAENLPMNGRSFQTLIELTPGVVVVPTNIQDEGQFSVNGQRASSNYWMVDGVSANIGMGVNSPGQNPNGLAGVVGSFSALGGTNSLVSVDAMQEFRIQTSTYAPEFGRTPGAQISIATRAGTNQFHGTVFDYFRNDALDANNWFNTSVTPAIPKPKERQNDFGGTFSGPLFKGRTFFFFSYEGLRLRLPQTVICTVPDLAARQSATPAMQAFLNAYPLPNGTDNVATGVAEFNSSFSNSANLDASSLRIDQKVNDKIGLFARYDYSPSEISQRGGGLSAPSVVSPIQITTQTGTAGATWTISHTVVNDLRFNYSHANAKSHSFLDDFGGAVPLASLPFPTPFTGQNGRLNFQIFALQSGLLADGSNARNIQRQVNVVDGVSIQKGSHALKFGADYRRLSPVQAPEDYVQAVQFGSIAAAKTGMASSASVDALSRASLLFQNLSLFAQDTWRIMPRITLTFGLRWDVDFAPSSLSGPSLPAVTGFNLADTSQLAVAPAGTPPFKTPYGNVAPRIGVAYQMHQNTDWQTVIRGGFGVFYDLASAQTGVLAGAFPPFGQQKNVPATFPLTPANSAPPVIPAAATLAFLNALNPNLQLPYTLQWNVALEQALGRQQAFTVSYIGANGRRLLQPTLLLFPPSNPKIFVAQLVDNSATSDYDALQVQFQRRLAHGLQALTSYSWAHSIDTASAGSILVASNQNIPRSNTNRGSSDFDIRHSLSLGLTYNIPGPTRNLLTKAVLRDWSVENAIQVRSAPPVDVADANFFQFNGAAADVRPDRVPGQPLYLFGSQFPGGKAFNPNAFTDPPTVPAGCNPAIDFPCDAARQGNLARNALRGFGAAQWDLAVHRDFTLRESFKLQFRAELFNALNHPNFGQPNGLFQSGGFGLATQTLNESLAGTGTTGAGSFSPLYQFGGPRSIQFALKLMF